MTAISIPFRRSTAPNTLLLSTFAFVKEPPQSINLLDHSVRLKTPLTDRRFLQFAYGTNASNECSFQAFQHATANGAMVLNLRLEFELRASLATGMSTAESVRKNGLVVVSRTRQSFREELLEKVHDFLRGRLVTREFTTILKLRLDAVLARHPEATAALMCAYPEIDVLVHEAPLDYNVASCGTIQVATIRKARARQMRAHVRYREDIPVRFGT